MKRTVVITGVWMVLAILPLFGQSKKDPLTEQQIEEVREAGIDPPGRIKLFVGYGSITACDISAKYGNGLRRVHRSG